MKENDMREYTTKNQTKLYIPNGDSEEYKQAYRNFISVLSEIIVKHSSEIEKKEKGVA